MTLGNEEEKRISSSSTSTAQDDTIVVKKPRSSTKSVILVLTVTFGMVVNLSNSTSVSISLPTVGKDLGLQEAQLQWLVSAYPLSSGCLLLVFGRVADLYGRKRIFLFGTSFMAIFTLSCGFAQNITALDILRGIQGIGAAAMIPASLGILAHAFPPSRARSLAFATFAAGAPLGGVFGNTTGGLLTEFSSKTWRSPYFLQCGLAVLCIIGGLISIDPDTPSTELDKRVDWLGALLVTAGLVLIVFVLGQGELAPQKWATPYIIALLVVGVVLIGLFLLWQKYLESVQNDPDAKYSWLTPPPLMKLSLWRRNNGGFAAMMVIAFVNWCSFLAWTFWVQLFYQDYMKYRPLQVVVRLLPMFFSGILCNLFVGFMAAYVPLVYLVVIGTASTSVASLLFANIVPSVTYWAFGFPATLVSVVGADFVFASGSLFIAKVSLPHEQSVSGALLQTMIQLGTAVGITVSTVVFNRVSQQIAPGQDNLKSYHSAHWTCFAFGVIGSILGLIFFRGVGVVGHRRTKEEKAQANLEKNSQD